LRSPASTAHKAVCFNHIGDWHASALRDPVQIRQRCNRFGIPARANEMAVRT